MAEDIDDMKEKSKDEFTLSRRAVIAGAALIPVSALTLSAQTTPSSFSSTARQTLEAAVRHVICHLRTERVSRFLRHRRKTSIDRASWA